MPLRLALALAALAFVSADVDPKAPIDDMTKAARAFVATLDARALEKARLPFDSDRRFEWFYTPVSRFAVHLESTSERSDPPIPKTAANASRLG